MSRATQDTAGRSMLRIRGFHPLRPDVPVRSPHMLPYRNAVLQPPGGRNLPGLGSSPFARHYWGNHYYFLFLRVLRCFSSPRSLTAFAV